MATTRLGLIAIPRAAYAGFAPKTEEDQQGDGTSQVVYDPVIDPVTNPVKEASK